MLNVNSRLISKLPNGYDSEYDSTDEIIDNFIIIIIIIIINLFASNKTITQLECGPMPNLMVALPNIGGALCSTPQSLADAHY